MILKASNRVLVLVAIRIIFLWMAIVVAIVANRAESIYGMIISLTMLFLREIAPSYFAEWIWPMEDNDAEKD